MSQQLRRAVRYAMLPAVNFFDARFTSLRGYLDERFGRTERQLDALASVERRIAADAEATLELASLNGEMAAWLKDQTARIPGVAAAESARSYVGKQLDAVDEGLAELLNYANSHKGFAAQAGLWFNPPVSLNYEPGQVHVGSVNERIAEVPYVFRALDGIGPGGHILDFGCAESTVSLSLAALGYKVTALDLHPYPLAHPGITVVAQPAESWDGPEEKFDAIVCLSTLEHAGLGWYGENESAQDLDRVILERMLSWLAPSGRLIFTAPFGIWSVSDFERRYDDEHLEVLFSGWKVLDRQVALQRSDKLWELVPGFQSSAASPSDNAVIMLQATPASI